MSCFAMRRVAVSSHTPGAVRASGLPKAVTVGPAGGYTPDDLATAYGQNPAAATNQIVGIVDAYNDPNALADLNTFDSNYGLPAETPTSFQQVSQTGSSTILPSNDTSGWSIEESLDLDAVRGMCNKCQIILVEANSNSFDDLSTAANEAAVLGANEISNSYGGADDSTFSPAQIAAYNHQGVVVTASTGDAGYYDWDYSNKGGASSNAPEFPASLNTVVAVGGTKLQLNDNGTRASESVWNENGSSDVTGLNLQYPMGATGGGCSTQFTAQKWQSSVKNYAATGCGTKRLSADISALADPYTGYDIFDSYNDGSGAPLWQTYGGTSLASPLIAAMWALAGGSGGVKYPSLSLYGHYNSTKGSVYDVTTGGNGYCDGVSPGECGAGHTDKSPNADGHGLVDCAWSDTVGTLAVGTRACEAGPGYDGPSGVGTPIGSTVFKAMGPSVVITAPSSIKHGKSVTFSAAKSSDPFPGGSITSYSWTFGKTLASGKSPKVKFAKAGKYSVTLTVTDSYGQSSTAKKTVTVK